jgi:hypothetical protein
LIKVDNRNEERFKELILEQEHMAHVFNEHQLVSTFINIKASDLVGSLTASDNSSTELPPIAWIYTDYEFENSKMIEQMLGNFIVQKAEESGYEVRKVNSWSAYQWLSEATKEKVTKTMQNMQIEVSVNEVLKMALLMEHGGLMFRLSEAFLVEDLKWVKWEFRETEVLFFS